MPEKRSVYDSLDKAERQALHDKVARSLERVKASEAEYVPRTIGALVSERANSHRKTCAINVFDRQQRATYEEVDILSNQFSHTLRSLGVRKGDRIAIMLPNRLEYPLLWFAIAKLGAITVPVNIRYTPREVAFIIVDTGAKHIVFDESTWPIVNGMEPWPVSLTENSLLSLGALEGAPAIDLEALALTASDGPVNETVGLSDLMNIQYTSGTTGHPKGVMRTHEFYSIASHQTAGYWDSAPHRRYLSAQPFFYGDPQGHLLRSYRQGGTLYLAPQLSSSRFMSWLQEYQIDWCSFPELVARQLEEHQAGDLCLRQVSSFGWSSETINRFRQIIGVPHQNGYGMTETSWDTLMPHDIDDIVVAGSLGVRAPFRELRLVNEDGTPTEPGEIGELWVRGQGLLKGYWNRPEANAERFEGEWFKTGDLLREDEMGFYWLCGRNKEMIRRSNENIAANEIEDVIRELPEVNDVAAIPVPDKMRGEEVKIVVELKEPQSVTDDVIHRIIAHARERLAVFKIPRYIAFIAVLPRSDMNAVKKISKKELTAVADPISGTYDVVLGRWR
jgi:acyl-CoA synthetase (AMP-forming)/AMP-acid ligase II